jgi:hypothetical protein
VGADLDSLEQEHGAELLSRLPTGLAAGARVELILMLAS